MSAWRGLVAKQTSRQIALPPLRRLGHQPVLDGVRGVAWLAVFAGHAGLSSRLAVGQVAMFVWFGLSGFLITSLIVGERSKLGTVSLPNFYARRALRLLPALGLFLLVWFLAVALFGHESWLTTVPGGGAGSGESMVGALEAVGAALAYVTNWFNIFHLFSGYVPLGHLWSLAVEEQFYLVWAPLLVLFLATRRRWVAISGALLLAGGSFADLTVIQHATVATQWVFFATDTRAGAFLIGSAAGLIWSRRVQPRQFWVRATTPLVVVAVGVMIVSAWLFALDRPVPALWYSANWIAVSVAAPLLVVALIDRPRGSRSVLTGRLLTYVGRRSYALYLWHYMWLTWLRDLGLAGVVGAFFASFVCAELSWRLVEARALAYKDRFAPTAARSRGVRARQEPGEVVAPSGLGEPVQPLFGLGVPDAGAELPAG